MTTTQERPRAESQAARRAMIDSQLRTSGVNEPWVLAAMGSIAREDFVPEPMKSAAYIDRAIPLGNGRSLPAPLVHAMMLREAAPRQHDKVLLIGDGDGYLAALMRPLAGMVDAIDAETVMAARGDGSYTIVLVDGAMEAVPETLASYLSDDGRLVCGLVEKGVTRLAKGRKTGERIALLPLAELGIPTLPQFAAPKRWSF